MLDICVYTFTLETTRMRSPDLGWQPGKSSKLAPTHGSKQPLATDMSHKLVSFLGQVDLNGQSIKYVS